MADMERLSLAIPNLDDEQSFDQPFSYMQALARATRNRANLAGPKESPTHEEIELRAYQIFQELGNLHGQDLEDWFEAERQLLGEKK